MRRPALVFFALAVSMLLGAQISAQEDQDPATSAAQALEIVDCLLPGQVRRVGGRTYPTPRRPTRTTAADCAARGGEYLVYDRASTRSALTVWLPTAEGGNAEAQTIVGELYERGVDGNPNYEAAAQWYRRAADQDYRRAQFNLGTLYEQGLGVPPDRLTALNWYRRASGLDEDSIIFQSAAAADLERQRAELSSQVESRDRQVELLTRQVQQLREQLESNAQNANQVNAELASLRGLLEEVEAQRRADREALDAIVRLGDPLPLTAARAEFIEPSRVSYRRSEFGRFYALIIGVQDYEQLEDLESPVNDIAKIGGLLADKYGFSVLTLADPDQLELMRAVNELNETLEENDNLLIYFTGHGSRLRSGIREVGYWLPTNADPVPDDTLWVPNDFVSRHIGRIAARRVLVIADSCYSGLLGDDPGYVMVGDGEYTDEYIEWKRPKRSRLVLSSGEDSPVVTDAAGESSSVFAKALLDVLNANQRVLTAPELFLGIKRRLESDAQVPAGATMPALKALKDAGHEVGDFFFIVARS
jgi:uncharacterized protein